jgi:hypothetical protein
MKKNYVIIKNVWLKGSLCEIFKYLPCFSGDYHNLIGVLEVFDKNTKQREFNSLEEYLNVLKGV